MTAFITDVRYGERFAQIRLEMFPKENFPASALIILLHPSRHIELTLAMVRCTRTSVSDRAKLNSIRGGHALDDVHKNIICIRRSEPGGDIHERGFYWAGNYGRQHGA